MSVGDGIRRRLLGVRSPSADARTVGEMLGQQLTAGLEAGLRGDRPPEGDLLPFMALAFDRAALLGLPDPRTGATVTAEVRAEWEARDQVCGWTHCFNCCGPCPECGLEGPEGYR